MCDYSLLGMRNRLAEEGERLVVHRFSSGSMGLASPADLRIPVKDPPDHTRAGWWSALRRWFSIGGEKSLAAVCIPTGSGLMLREIPPRLQQQLGVGAEEEVTFVQLSASADIYRDAVRFKNGREILLQKLEEGQPVDVVCLSSVEAVPRQMRPVAAAR